RTINSELLALEKAEGDAPRGRAINELFRAMHSLKSAARAVDVRLVEVACHGLESLLATARDGRRSLAAADIDLIFASADAVADAGQRLRSGAPLDGSPLEALLPRIEGASVVAAQKPLPVESERTLAVPASTPASTPPDGERAAAAPASIPPD